MKKKDVVFTIGLCIFTGIMWMAGELVMGLWIAAPAWVHILWFVLIVVVTLTVSVWHSLVEDESGQLDPKREKYERKVSKRRGITEEDD